MSTALLSGTVGARVTTLRPRLVAAPSVQYDAAHAALSARPIRPARVAQPRLRITARGRAVLLVLASLPVVIAALLFGINGGGASASLEGSSVPLEYVTVQPGDSLWQVAESIAPFADPRDVISAIVSLNGLTSADVFAGEQLEIPAQYDAAQYGASR